MVLTKRTSNLPLICQICGDIARGINFEVMTCMSCKAFFRRHALQSKSLQCQLSSDCEITRLTRHGCSACRLRKCFSFGMNPQLIRYNPQKPSRFAKKRNQILPKPMPLNLLENDSSTLTTIEWNLLSNILHAYDESNAITCTKSLLEHQQSLPPKLRSKPAITLDIVGFIYSSTQSFIQRTQLFNDLSADDRRAIVQRNCETIGTYNSIYLVRETNALDYSSYSVGCCNLYGQANYVEFKKYLSQLEPNGTFFKLMLLIIAFSANCSIVLPDYIENYSRITSIMSIIQIQNVIVTMFWKYLNYQYGFFGAVKCFNSMIKYILNIIRWSNDRPSSQHIDMVDAIIENTERSLTLEDELIE